MGKKETKRFSKQLGKQIDAATAGTRYTLDAATGKATKDEPKGKKQKKPTEEQIDKFCNDARKAAEDAPKPAAFDPEPNLTKAQQDAAQQRAGLRAMLYGLTGLK